MSLLIRKNSKIANFHCPYNTKYTQKISIHSDSDVGQKYLSRLIIKILFPNSQKPRKHIYNICFPANICDTIRTLVTELLDPGGDGQDKCKSGGFMSSMRSGGSGVPCVTVLKIIVTLCNTAGSLPSQVSRHLLL